MSFQPLITNLSKETIDIISEQNKDYAQVKKAKFLCTHGICMRLSDQKDKSDWVQILPMTLVPSKVPERLFKQAYKVQKDISLLYHRVAFDYDFLKDTLAPVIQTNNFIKHLFTIYTEVYGQKSLQKNQPIVLTILRSDYMFHVQSEDSIILRQVEVNTIAAGGAGLGTNVTNMHKHMIRNGTYCTPGQKKFVPDNGALKNVAGGLVEAYKIYGNNNAIIVIIIENLNQNIMDQRMVEYEICRLLDSHVIITRFTLTECHEKLSLTDNTKLVTNKGNLEVAVVYFRSGYSPDQYPTEREWEARMMIEKSQAIKCPWVGAQLAGTKKVQQVLANPNMLQRFLRDEQSECRIRNTFAGLYGLEKDDPNTDTIVARACANPDNYVLKPQLEGGGNNLFGQDLLEALKTFSPVQREAYILMDRLRPLSQDNVLVRAHQPLTVTKMDSELGIFGYLLGSANEIIVQAQDGHMIRTKPSDKNEGGIGNGNAGHDSPFLF